MLRENNALIPNEVKEKLMKDGVKFATNFIDLEWIKFIRLDGFGLD